LKNELEYEDEQPTIKHQENNCDDVFLTEAPGSVRGDFSERTLKNSKSNV
jgi:hypothetical protein